MRHVSIAILSVLLACSAATSAPEDVSIGQSIALQPGQSAHVPGAAEAVALVKVNDSRCPSDVVCVTAGDALVVLEFSGAGAPRTDTLKVNLAPKKATYGEYSFEVIAVDPYPVSSQPNATKTVTLLVRTP